MNAPKPRADDRLDAWARATARPVPAFAPRPKRVPWVRAVSLVAVAASVLLGLIVGAFALGSPAEVKTKEPTSLAATAAEAIATAPGVGYSLSVIAHYPDGTIGIDSEGSIDFEQRRFSGSARGSGGSPTMLFFGGPNNGALIIANGLFVRTETGPWERQPDQATPLDPFLDRAQLSKAIASAFAKSEIDPAIRVAPCGATTCQVIGMTLPPAVLAKLAFAIFGDQVSELPPDLVPPHLDLSVDGTGFPVLLESQVSAGTTNTSITLRLTRLDPAPAIAPPIP
jgi:hypothetical protein